MQKTKIKNKVMKKVLDGSVRMKSKWWFVAGSIMSFVGLIFLTVATTYFFNVLNFLIRMNGLRGWQRLWEAPWWLLSLGVMLLLFGIFFLKRYDFSYKKNFGAIILVFLSSLLVAGYLVDQMGLNERLIRGRGGRMMYGAISESIVKSDPKKLGTLELERALKLAIEDEYKARATYLAVIKKFGEVRPFVNIVRSEERHIASLETLIKKYGYRVPVDKQNVDISGIETVSEACQIGYDAEVSNADLYQKDLIPSVIEYIDVVAVFEGLSNASLNNHLRAFARCK